MTGILKQFDLVPLDVPMIAISAVLFLLFWKGMERSFFLKHLALVEKRESLTTGAHSEATEIKRRAAELAEQYERDLSATRFDAMSEKLAALAKARAEASAIGEEADAKAQEIVRNTRWQLQHELDEARTHIENEARILSDVIVSKLRQVSRGKSGVQVVQ